MGRIRRGFFAAAVLVAAQAHVTGVRAASIVTDWLDVAIPTANFVTPEPTVASRLYAILHTAMFDAWAAYDEHAVAVASGTALKGTGGEPTIGNKREAVSYAAYTVLTALAPVYQRFADEFMQQQGFDVTARTAPAVLGRRAARAVLHMRHHDGANQDGDYADTSGYTVADDAVVDHWQPAATDTMNTGLFDPTTPHWSRVMPFALTAADQFRPPPPPAHNTPTYAAQIEEILQYSAGLTDEQKAMMEYWAPFNSQPASHLVTLTKFVSLRDDLRLDDDIKLFFIVSNTLLDAGIAAWDAKYHYDYIRPYTAIRRLGERLIVAWDNPNRGISRNHLPAEGKAIDWGRVRGAAPMKAADWLPYLPTPPFPEYVSGHSTFTAAWARAMELVTVSPSFDFRVERQKLYVEDRWLDRPVTLFYPTYWSAAESSGISRVYAGVHWMVANRQGLALGRQVAELAWRHAQRYIAGNISPLVTATQALRAPFWRPVGDSGADQAAFDAADGLSIRFTSYADDQRHGSWRTLPLDPLPGGRYRINATVKVFPRIDAAVNVSLQILDAGSNGEVLETTQLDLSGADPRAQLGLIMQSNAGQPIRLQFQAQRVKGMPFITLTNLDLRWIEPEAAWKR